jgi:hypothetical protein
VRLMPPLLKLRLPPLLPKLPRMADALVGASAATARVAIAASANMELRFNMGLSRGLLFRQRVLLAIGRATGERGSCAKGNALASPLMERSSSDELIPNFMQTARRVAIGLACNTEDTKAAMEAGGVYEFYYRDVKFQSLGGFVVTSADCR